MKILKITNSLLCLTVLLATLATSPALHASQASAQNSASFSGMSSQQAPAISAANSGSLAASSIGSSSPVSLATKKPIKTTVTTNQFIQLIDRGDKCAKQGDFIQAIRLYRLAFDNTNDRPELQILEAASLLGIEIGNNCSSLIIEYLAGMLILNGRDFTKKNRPAEAFSLYVRAYYLSKSSPKLQIGPAKEIGGTLYQKGGYNEALPYLERAHEIFEKLDNTGRQQFKLVDDFIVSLLGEIHLDYTASANNRDYEKAFKFLTQAYYSSDDNLKMFAASHLGNMYLDGLGQTVDLVRARSFFKEAVLWTISSGLTTSGIAIRASSGLYLSKFLQLEQFDDFYQSLGDEPSEDRMKEARALLEEAHKTQDLPPDLNALLEAQIKIYQEKLNKFAAQLAQDRIQKERQNEMAKKTATQTSAVSSETVDRQCTIKNQALEEATVEAAEKKSIAENAAKLSVIVKEADIEFEAYLTKSSYDSYKRARSLYFEALPLSRRDAIRKHIWKQLRILDEAYAHQLEAPNISESSEKKEEKRDQQQATWTILDPFDQMKNQDAAQARLQELATNPGNVLQSEKFQALSQACSTRCGSGDRIIYLVLPQYHSVGIINRGPHEDYGRVELLRHREDWFLHPAPEAITIAIEQARKRNDEEQAKALTEFLQQSSSQRSSTDSKEAKERKS